jgi:hypothetical protein
MDKKIKVIKPLSTSFVGMEKNPKKGTVKYSGCNHNIRPAEKMSGGYETGLELLNEEGIPLYKYFEKELNLTENTLASNSSYWDSFKVTIYGDKGTIFDLTDPYQAIKYYVACADEIVALGDDRDSIIKKPKAKFFTVDEERSAKEESDKRKLRREADDIIRSATLETKRKYARLLGNDSVANESVTELILDSFLDKVVNDNPNKIIDISKQSAASITLKSEVKELLEYGVLVKRDGRIHRLINNELGQDLGVDVDQVTKFLAAPKNQDIRAVLKEELKNRKISSNNS